MATNTITVTWCDVCLQRGVQTPGEQRGLPYVDQPVDLCDPCLKELTTAVRTFTLSMLSPSEVTTPVPEVGLEVRTSGLRRGRQPANGKRPWICFLCEYDQPAGVEWDYSSLTGLRRHYELVHGLEVTVASVHGEHCPLDGEYIGSGRGALSRHAHKHRAANVSQLFRKAIAKGDRHGVVQGRIEALTS